MHGQHTRLQALNLHYNTTLLYFHLISVSPFFFNIFYRFSNKSGKKRPAGDGAGAGAIYVKDLAYLPVLLVLFEDFRYIRALRLIYASIVGDLGLGLGFRF